MKSMVVVLILSLTLEINTQKFNDGNVLIGYLKFLNTKLQMNKTHLMSVDDEKILKVILEIIAKDGSINQKSMSKIDHLLRSISMRLGKTETDKLAVTSKHMHWRQGR